MPLPAHTHLGHYEILGWLGAGGMGEVYRAEDTRLHRDVAIKVSAERFGERFEREARAVAALNHPNICTLHDVGPDYLVMELVEGPTLAERIKEGAVPFDEALTIARQIAAALEAAHEKGIVHRDLKPANIKIKPDGLVKVLDFGLAKVAEPDVAGRPESSPTLTLEQATRAGVVLGTAAYMAPEQARGTTVDKRADIWAFGVVLYEMLTGRRLFQGETVSDTLAAVLRQDPEWGRVPAQARRLLQSCLEKDPARRLRDIADAWRLLEDAPDTAARRQPWLAWGAAALLLATTLAVSFMHFREKPAAAEPLRFQIFPPEKSSFLEFQLSPDGRRLAFTARGSDGHNHLWVRALDSLQSRLLPGTENAFDIGWSPDSRFILFQSSGKLRNVEASGGPPQVLSDVPLSRGFSLNRNGEIITGGSSDGLRRISASGVPSVLTTLDASRQERFHASPLFLPDGRHFLYVRYSTLPENSGIYIGSLDAKPEDQGGRRLLGGQMGPLYTPSPDPAVVYLLFLRERTLMAQPLDTRRLRLAGEAVPLAESVGDNGGSKGNFSISTNGVLAYSSGRGLDSRLTWFNRQGRALGTAGERGQNLELALSPDGARVAVHRHEGENRNIWLIELARSASARFTFGFEDNGPVWSPDGSQIIFGSQSKGLNDLYRKASSGAAEEEVLLQSQQYKVPQDWSRDGRFLLYSTEGAKTGWDLWVLPLEGDRKPTPFLVTPFRENQGRISPDGRWIVYTSDESGKTEVYVRPFPASPGGGKWMVSTAGGDQPRWRRDGKELFYFSLDGKLMSVEASIGPSFKAGIPRPLFETPVLFGAGGAAATGRWDVAADGQRFLIISPEVDTASTSTPITVVLNWTAGLKR